MYSCYVFVSVDIFSVNCRAITPNTFDFQGSVNKNEAVVSVNTTQYTPFRNKASLQFDRHKMIVLLKTSTCSTVFALPDRFNDQLYTLWQEDVCVTRFMILRSLAMINDQVTGGLNGQFCSIKLRL